jgi:hypothetical protein
MENGAHHTLQMTKLIVSMDCLAVAAMHEPRVYASEMTPPPSERLELFGRGKKK